MNITKHLIAAGLGVAALVPAADASAQDRRPAIDLRGQGTFVDEGWRITAAGTVAGRPFQGDFHAAVYVDGGVWPTPGTCTTGSVSAVIDGPHRHQIWSVALGAVCQSDAASDAVVFTGEFDTYDSTPKRLSDIQGQMVLRLTPDGIATLAVNGA